MFHKPGLHQGKTKRARLLRAATVATLAVLSIGLALLAIHQGFFRLVAWSYPSTESFFYNLAVFGIYRTTKFVTLDVQVPLGNVERWDESCGHGLVMIAPFGVQVPKGSGPLILDSRGELVWAADSSDNTATNVNVQRYKGKPYLTFWAGNKHGGEGVGQAYMLDSSYKIWKQFKAHGEGLRTDLHEFFITDDGHAIISAINDTTADMRDVGWFHTENDWVENGVFQEIDIETGELVFQWRSLDYYSPAESYAWRPMSGYIPNWPYDYFHLNSIQKDSKGNYLVSSRHLHKLMYVAGQSGDVLWTIGGRKSSSDFADLSDGAATDFQWQHHARWISEDEISIMDNGQGGNFQGTASSSRAMIIKVDQDNRTVELVHSYTSMDKLLSPSQGSVQVLPNDNVFVGWGPAAAWSEFKSSGELLCEYHFAASWFFWTQRVKNYRAFKVYDWKGKPDYPPTARKKNGKLYVSWNGATEVRSWKLQRMGFNATSGEETYGDVETIEKRGFESVFTIPSRRASDSYRVVALDSDREEIGVSETAVDAEGGGFFWITAAVLFLVFCLVMGLWWFLRFRGRRGGEKGQSSIWELGAWDRYRYSRL
ncbi:hypothetical protein MBLNU230_g7540t1 [Neophaeotheca triangularis]